MSKYFGLLYNNTIQNHTYTMIDELFVLQIIMMMAMYKQYEIHILTDSKYKKIYLISQ